VCSHYFNLGIHGTTAVGESILAQTICKHLYASIKRLVSACQRLSCFCWMVGKHFTLRLRNLGSRLQIKERAVECRDGFLAKSCKSIQNIKIGNEKEENESNTNIS
jgi:hypothetical protein